MTRARGMPFRFGRLAVLLLFGGLLNMAIHTSVSGKEGEAEKVLSLSAVDVQRLRRQAEEAKNLTEETQAKILETYDRALAQLEAAEDWSNKATAFDRVREEAPEATETLEQKLKADLPEAKLEVPKDASLDQLELALMEVKLDQETANEQLNKLEAEVTRRRERRRKVPELLAVARQRLEVARENKNVLRDPPPSVVFMEFGASSLDFALRAFTKIDTLLTVRDELNMAIDKAFREDGIEIAFPQRDIHIRSVKDTFPIATKEPDEKAEQED